VKYLGGRSNGGYHNEKTGFRSFFISFDDGARLELMNKPMGTMRAALSELKGIR